MENAALTLRMKTT